jgi:glutamate synthase (NADPH/NADH) small chain
VADPKGFLNVRQRELPERRPVPVRIQDWREVYEDTQNERGRAVLRRQAGRCMDCGIPFCHHGCPLGNLIPEWNDLTWRGDDREASERLHATNNFPEFTGRLCPAPCESSCVLGINQPAVTIKQVEVSIADTAFAGGWVVPKPPDRLTGKTVAVVGSGPAGLAVAQQLTRAGHTVAVYERADRIGGLLRYGIPEFKMEKRHLDRRLAQMEAEGTRFRPGVAVGEDVTGRQLRDRYDAVVLAVGATAWRDLDVPGRELDGVLQAMQYLPPANRRALGEDASHLPFGDVTAEGKDVVVLGGGDTGADCLGTALRQGARSVTQLEIMPQPPLHENKALTWPHWPMKLRTSSSQEEGAEREFSVVTTEFKGEDGRVRALRCARTELVRGPDGRMIFEQVPGSEFELKADLVLLAMGFLGPVQEGAIAQSAVELTPQGNVRAPFESFRTSHPRIFACGDVRRGQSLVVWAIREGRDCAEAIHAVLGAELRSAA